MNHHPTWEEVREEYFRDPAVQAAYDEGYAPPGYAEIRAASAAR